MKYCEALKIINDDIIDPGYRVAFEWVEGRGGVILHSDYFPDTHAGEELIETEEEAWVLARKFAEKTKGKVVNIYVTYSDLTPVKHYRERYIKNE